MKLFEIIKEDIERLDQKEFTFLMQKLLRAELSKLKLKQSELVSSLDINDPDGGLDAYISSEIPENHIWLPSGKSGWQFKAVREFSANEAAREVLNEKETDLKPRIKKLLEQGETYVQVIGRKDYNPDAIEEREERIRETFSKYDLPKGKVKFYSSLQIAEWVNLHPSVVAYLKPDRTNFKDIKEWREKIQVIREPSEFVPDVKREGFMKSIRETIISNQNGERATIIRIVGLSGVGKTRLIYETINIDELKELVLYTESPDKLPLSRFNEIARNENISAILVIDECPHEKYVELAKETEGIGGRMTLITLDYDIDLPLDRKDMHILLEGLDDAALNKLIQLIIPSLPDFARRKIVEFSQGYPRIAVSLSDHFSSRAEVLTPKILSELAIADLYERIIAGRHRDNSEIAEVKNVLTMIALFKRLGWDEEVSEQGEKVCEIYGIKWMDARKIVREQEDRGLVIRRGRYRYISPLPLVIHLASKWWEAMDDSSWSKFFNQLPDLETEKAFLERLADLPYLGHAKIIFSVFNYKLLDSKDGSEIFLSLVNADHLSAIDKLERILDPLTKEELHEFKVGRRNVIEALEKIAWWEDTFHRAAKLLLKLADAENENWANNATGIFTRLFQTFLGGTTVPAWKRHKILEEALNSSDNSLQKLALKGLDAAFNLSHSTRMVGGEEQGTIIPPPEWKPQSREDLSKSIMSAFEILSKAMNVSDYEIQAESTKIFLQSVRDLLLWGFKDKVMETLRHVQNKFPELEKNVLITVDKLIFLIEIGYLKK